MKKEARQLQRGNRNLLLTFKSGIEHFCQSHTVQFPYVRTIASPRRASQDLVSHGESFDSSALFPFQGSSQLPKIPHRGLRREGTEIFDGSPIAFCQICVARNFALLLHVFKNASQSFLLASHSCLPMRADYRITPKGVLSLSRSRCLTAFALFAFQHPSQSERIFCGP